MLEDIAAQLKIFVGLFGASLAAGIGILARNVYSEEAYSLKRAVGEGIFAMFVALVAGGIGEYLELPALVIYGLAGAAGYLGPHFLAEWLRRKAGKGADDEAA